MVGSFLFFSLFFCCCAGKPLSKDHSWEFLHLAQFWPGTSCYIHFGQEYCSGIPKGVTGWTIHGLWPSQIGSEKPQYCNSSLKFDYNQIKSLSSSLAVRWPSYNTSGDPTDLWKHEWEKHGTCAMDLPALRGEPNYFALTMVLQQPLDLYGNLARHKIVPSSSVMYQPADIYWAILSELGVMPNVVCSYDKKNQRHYIEQIWVCYTKEFLLQDCPDVAHHKFSGRGSSNKKIKEPSRFSNCPDIGTPSVYYLPLTPPTQGYREKKTFTTSEANVENRLQEGNVRHENVDHQGLRKQVKQSSESVIYFRSEVEQILRRQIVRRD